MQMKAIMPAALAAMLASQSVAAAPETAMLFTDHQRGTFVGARLRLPLGNKTEKPSLGLAFTGMERGKTGELHFSRGLELGLSNDHRLNLSVSGKPLNTLRPNLTQHSGQVPHGQKAGVSTVGWIAIGVGAALIVGTAVVYQMLDDASE